MPGTSTEVMFLPITVPKRTTPIKMYVMRYTDAAEGLSVSTPNPTSTQLTDTENSTPRDCEAERALERPVTKRRQQITDDRHDRVGTRFGI